MMRIKDTGSCSGLGTRCFYPVLARTQLLVLKVRTVNLSVVHGPLDILLLKYTHSRFKLQRFTHHGVSSYDQGVQKGRAANDQTTPLR